MIVRGGTDLKAALRYYIFRNWRVVAFVLAVEVGAWTLYDQIPGLRHTAFSAGAVGVLATVVGIFLAFRFNEAYARWWEARILWGGMVNISRSFARQVTTLITRERVHGIADWEYGRAVQRELVYRHLAYVNALRRQLRDQEPLEDSKPFLPEPELAEFASAKNPAVQMIQRQAQRFAELFDESVSEKILMTHLDTSLTEIMDLQGGMERIKNTAFPDRVIVISRVFVWTVALLLPLAFVEGDLAIYPLGFVATATIALSFFLVKQLGEELTNPFDNRMNDTPMTALCRTIEIDLRQQLGESEVPEPLAPVDGVLM